MTEPTAAPRNHPIADPELCTGCLNCQLACSLAYQHAFNPAKARLTLSRARGRTSAIRFEDGCTRCGLCARHCLYGALAIPEAPT